MTDWPVKTLGDLCEVSIGGIWGSEAGEDEVDVFVYRSTELIKDGQLKEQLTVRRSITTKQLDSRKLKEGDLLLEKSGGGPKTPVGRVGLVKVLPGLSVCSNFMQLMRPRKGEVLPIYLHYFLNHFHIAGHTEDLQNNSTNIRNLKTTEYMAVEISVPPLEEQKRIVALLDAATAHVTELSACYEQARTHANNLFTSALRDELEGNPDWPVKTLGDVVRFDSKTARPEDLSKRDVYIGLENIASDGTLIGLGNVLAETLKSNKARFTDNHILFGKLRPYLVKVVRPDFNGVCSTDILPISPSAELARDFLYWYMRSPAVIEAATEASTGTTLPRVSPTTLKSFEIFLPPLEEQQRIVARLDSMRAKTSEMTAAYDSKLAAAKNLRQSILEAAFAGQL